MFKFQRSIFFIKAHTITIFYTNVQTGNLFVFLRYTPQLFNQFFFHNFNLLRNISVYILYKFQSYFIS